MPQPIRVQHVVDPKEQIFAETKQYIDGFHLLAAKLLVVTYERATHQEGEAVTPGGILIPKASAISNTAQEDRHQGKVGLVVKLGPLSFKTDDRHSWPDRTPVVGDWVVYRIGDGFAFDIPGKNAPWKVTLLEDVLVHMIIDDVQAVY